MPKHTLRNSVLAALITATLAQHAYAGYVVMDDDLFPTRAIPASVAASNRISAPSPTNNRAPTAPTSDNNSFAVTFKKSASLLIDSTIDTMQSLVPAFMGKQIVVVGRPDERPNQTLASNRAKSVRIWLIRQGVPSANIEIEVDNTPNQTAGLGSPVEIKVIDPYSRPTLAAAPAPASAPVKEIPTTTLAAITVQPKADDRAEMMRQIATAAHFGRIDAKSAVTLIYELYVLPANKALPTSVSTTALAPVAALVVPVTPPAPLAPPPKPPLVLVASKETARPKEWILDTAKTGKDNLIAWGATENYKLDWRASNYYKISGSPRPITGELLDAINEFTDAAGLTMEVWKKDKLIRITDDATKNKPAIQ